MESYSTNKETMLLQNKKVITFILAGGKGTRLYPLTKSRSKPAVYFAARFRIIDFVLSNCINSGLRQIYVLTQTKSLSLEQHLRQGWNFLPNELSQFIATVPAQQRISEQWYTGTADAIYQNLHLLEDHRPEHVLILSGDHIYNMDFNEIYQQHLDNNSDLTASVLTIKKSEASEFGVLSMGEDLQIKQFIEKPEDISMIPGTSDDCHINMGIYIFKTKSLVRMLAQDARSLSSHDFGKNIIPDMLDKYRVHGFVFKNSRFGHYWKDVGTIKSYFDSNMQFLNQLGGKTICTPDWPVSTVGVQLPPTFYGGKEGVFLNNSSVGIGSYLFDCTVVNSLIGRNVVIEAGTTIKDSIIMANCRIGKNCIVKNTIFDDGASIKDNTTIGENPEEDKKHFFISEGIAILPKNFKF
jgi:glucose-1-phosphate adenylyltransferase